MRRPPIAKRTDTLLSQKTLYRSGTGVTIVRQGKRKMLDGTLITAALLAFVNIWLGYRVGQIRTREKVSLGDAGKPALVARMRAHANFGEYVPLPVILIGLIEKIGRAHV